MASATSNSIWYVYGIVAANGATASPPPGLDDAGVSLEKNGDVAALVSVLDGATYAPDVLEASSGEVEWLSPRAVAHDLVLTWASDRGPVVPLPMFSLFSSREALSAMLAERATQLRETLERVARGREYAVRVYRVDAELLASIASLSPRLAELAAAAQTASPGQRYLLERKLEGEKRTEMRSVSASIVDEILMELGARALETVRSPIPRAAGTEAISRGTMVVNAAFLVSPDGLEAFQKTLTSLVERHGAHGFRFDFTGPWPPYHFVGEAANAT